MDNADLFRLGVVLLLALLMIYTVLRMTKSNDDLKDCKK
jgi:hypothetical protein